MHGSDQKQALPPELWEKGDEAGWVRDKDPETDEKCGKNCYPFFIFIQTSISGVSDHIWNIPW